MLGHNWLENIKINCPDIKLLNTYSILEQVLDQYSAVFTSSIGKLKEVTAKILVNPEAFLHFIKVSSVPHSLKEKVIKELQHLQDLRIITPVKHSNCAALIVPIVKAGGSIRLCGITRSP